MQILTAFQEAGWVGKAVLAILLLFSVLSWAVIVIGFLRFNSAALASARFLKVFRRSRKLADVQAASNQLPHSPLVGLFRAAYAEIESQLENGVGKLKSMNPVERALQRAVRVETARLTRNLPFLATTAAATPFIGLFGTVWGIMIAFGNIGTMGTTSITAVAPGISEALINTAAGLLAAIPALIAYNHFQSRIRMVRGEMEEFSLELLNLTERNFA